MAREPITSAPRDGRYIRGWNAIGEEFRCRWYTRDEIAESEGGGDPSAWDPGWYDGDDAYDERVLISWVPIEAN